MPLKISLRSGQKFIVNGAVIENPMTHPVELTLMNKASILRERDIITQDEAVTPASRAYFALQNFYLFPDKADHYLKFLNLFLTQFEEALPGSRKIVETIRTHLEHGQSYQALKKGRELIDYEGKVLAHGESGKARDV